LTKLKPDSELLERYKVKSLLAKGGMGSAYLCFDKVQQEEVVLKLPHSDQLGKKKKRFLREYSLLSQITHKNIVKVFELHELEDGRPFFTMEYLKGNTLKEYIATRSTKLIKSSEHTLQALKLLEELADALCVVHSFGLLHHDLKPENIILVPATSSEPEIKWQLKLLDFGVALDQFEHTAEEAEEGSLFYKAPEQHKGRKLDATADIYAFGAIAFELFSGRRPFNVTEDQGPIQAIFRISGMHMAGSVPVLKGLHPKVCQTVNRLIQICMEEDSELRYPSITEVLERIRATRADLRNPSWVEKIVGRKS